MIPQETMNSDEIYEDLCNKIEKLVYLPGDKISENELCRQYGVSRHIIRTVISRLKERMLLTVYPQRMYLQLLQARSAVVTVCSTVPHATETSMRSARYLRRRSTKAL